ncbi:HD-GYP domain-containing protein [Tepidibacillus sp. HK-1]|uniref:HD-GYP domain-containing protein n=1 Tax=Tepidibacillus sp. HK-1 TaxID=1883407 RepID=UPI000852A153|nr:HD-GYP domain-containing protein [Tepidibacillus sp. HK-1]GBF10242.1 cyclic di-GMP phosphodiesterase response regulator RpfG [Tepidibacillus sp. HK-1]
MRRIPTTKCQPGVKLAKPILNDIGGVLIAKDVELTQSMIERLLQLGVDSLYIYDARTDDIEVKDVLSDKTRELALKSIKDTFQDMFKEKLVHRPLTKGNLTLVFKPVLDHMLDDMKANQQAMLMLSSIYIKDLYLYTHSLQVAIYSISMGMAKGYNQQQLSELGLGAMLHDIGKTKVPISVLEKKEPLTEEEFALIRSHTEYGFDLLRKEPGIPLLSAHCAYQHHERINGGGYPRGLSGDDIHEYARIVAIADVYDALVSKRAYKNTILPHEALEFLYSKAGVDFDRDLLELFRKTIAIYPIGTNIILNSGELGIVVDINSKYPDRPIIRVLEDKNQGIVDSPYEIDLSKESSKVIISCLN